MGLASAMLRRDSPHRACTVLAALPVCDRVLITLHRQMLGGVNVPQMLCGTNQGIGPSRAGKAVDTPGGGGGPVGTQGVQVVAAGEADHHQQVQHAQVPHQQPCACAHNPPHLRRSQGSNVSSGRATSGMPTEKFEGLPGAVGRTVLAFLSAVVHVQLQFGTERLYGASLTACQNTRNADSGSRSNSVRETSQSTECLSADLMLGDSAIH